MKEESCRILCIKAVFKLIDGIFVKYKGVECMKENIGQL